MTDRLKKHDPLYLAAITAGREMGNNFSNLSCFFSNWNIIDCDVKFRQSKITSFYSPQNIRYPALVCGRDL